MGAKRYTYIGDEKTRESCLRVVMDFDKLKAGPGLVKDDVKSSVVRADCDGEAVYCKRFSHGGWAGFLKNQLRFSKALKCFRNAEKARERGIPTVEHLAAVIQRGMLFLKASYLITRDMTRTLPLQLFIKSRFPKESRGDATGRGFTRQLARFVATVHSKGLVHGDLKGANLLVREKDGGEWEFFVLDLDDVSFAGNVPMKVRIENLVQLNNDCMYVCRDKARLRFLIRYLEESGMELARSEKRGIVEEIGRLTARKVERWRLEEERLMRSGKERHRDESMRVGGRGRND